MKIIIFFSALVLTDSLINGITLKNNTLEIMLLLGYVFIPLDLMLYGIIWKFLKRFYYV